MWEILAQREFQALTLFGRVGLNQYDNDSIDESSYANNDQSSKEKKENSVCIIETVAETKTSLTEFQCKS